MPILQEIAPCLWFDDQAEEAVRFYLSIFTDSKIESIARYTKEGFEIHGRPDGSAMTVSFHLAGQNFTALNGGPFSNSRPRFPSSSCARARQKSMRCGGRSPIAGKC